MDVLYAIYDVQLAQHGGMDGLRDRDMIESAPARPRQLARYSEPPLDAANLAAAYASDIVRKDGFNDDNGRTAWFTARLFLLVKGCALNFTPPDAIGAVLALATATMSEA